MRERDPSLPGNPDVPCWMDAGAWLIQELRETCMSHTRLVLPCAPYPSPVCILLDHIIVGRSLPRRGARREMTMDDEIERLRTLLSELYQVLGALDARGSAGPRLCGFGRRAFFQ